MATRAVSVVIERSPSGLRGWHVSVGAASKWMHGSDFLALGWIRGELEAAGAKQSERHRVLSLLTRELNVRRRAEVTAEVSHE